jgi:hypothetical protein
MFYIPHEKLSINWAPKNDRFVLSLPWLSLEVDVEEKDKAWVQDATDCLHSQPSNQNVQRFISELKENPIFYIQPRSIGEFQGRNLQPCTPIKIDTSTPAALVNTFGCEINEDLKKEIPLAWTWNWDQILNKARILGTDLYDPISFVSYLVCYRLEWENATWSGQDEFGQFLKHLVQQDEEKFFQVMGWIVKQSWYITSEACQLMKPALTHFEKARDLLHHYISDELGHHKFMEQVFRDLELKKEDFPVGSGTKWQLDVFARTAALSPLAFSALVNLFEASFYDGEDPISQVLRLSSKPHAARGYDLHYKINEDNRHCDMPVQLASYLAPQTYDHAALTLGLFELTTHFVDYTEKELVKGFELR